MEASQFLRFYHIDEDHKFMNNMMGENHHHHHDGKYDHHDDTYISESSSSSSFEDSNNSKESSSSDLLDDASSTSSSPSSPNGPLYELSDLMNQLPINFFRRGLSKFYQGKSQSFTSLAKVASLEDLAKKDTPYQRRLKACKSYGGGLNNYKSYTLPKSGISKKNSKGSLSNLSCLTRKGSFCRPPLSPVQSTF
ncbi:uncharacterized protein LOC110715533 [Chenopodium quinoa]|uniref:uncharacterized protein LOC110715533 n=1 Tax=Chenopodium quinoa TaxID=63459 RepID=UPI000B782296|nr:uncharacterized protein LOC110715533 [Chenopodium quinoa]